MHNLVKSLQNLIRKDYELAIIVDSFMQVFFAKNIDSLMVKLAII